MNKLTKCPTCGSLCGIGGDDKEGTHYFIPQENELKNRIEELSKTLHTFAAALAYASQYADEKTKESYLNWMHEIAGILDQSGIRNKVMDKTLDIVKFVPELLEDLELHCQYCNDCDFKNVPDKDCAFGKTWIKIKEASKK